MDDFEEIPEIDLPSAPWTHLLNPMQRAWREDQFVKGRNPDPHIEAQLREGGLWPEKKS